ncbi:GNAT family N-acetyltransferase [Alkalihalobacillus sp. TS-13]|uniref:GNAT family N-acetyltransferase n=1 Tax=Alkalihalobacillus sp. TS-13 TaxID=2842455 RepID=UPI001C88DD3C|nr:GNAT family N-acetyltransferase [Alkalihalobacillus sp. TS-13]
MEQMKSPSIKLKGHLEKQDYEEINGLQKYCVMEDNVTLKLELDYKWSKALDKSVDINRINEFMFYDEGTLIGYIGICQFGRELEVNGMVHPEYRRMGVFNSLFSLVKDEWYKRKTTDMLLLCDNTSLPGLEFIKRTGALYDNSEYEMYLRGKPNLGSALNDLILRKAINKDAKEIARQNAMYFQVESVKEDLILPEEEAKRGVDIFIVEIDNTIIGKVHLAVNDGLGGIYGLGVLPEYRRKGYGREILMKAIDYLNERQVNKIMLQVAVKNKNALDLYKSCGFVETSKMDYYKLSK